MENGSLLEVEKLTIIFAVMKNCSVSKAYRQKLKVANPNSTTTFSLCANDSVTTQYNKKWLCNITLIITYIYN
jgi:hypothetical protein